MTSWRPARSLATLLTQVNTLAPGRSKASDGIIGDTAHAATASDHNPDAAGVVHALDLTHDPAHGLDAGALAIDLVNARDHRISYVISNRRICSATVAPWTWRPYSGSDSHTSHVHLSVVGSAAGDDPAPWDLGATPQSHTTTPAGVTVKTIDLRAHTGTGPGVRPMQRLLSVPADGVAGPQTRAALGAVQRRIFGHADYLFGSATATALLAGK